MGSRRKGEAGQDAADEVRRGGECREDEDVLERGRPWALRAAEKVAGLMGVREEGVPPLPPLTLALLCDAFEEKAEAAEAEEAEEVRVSPDVVVEVEAVVAVERLEEVLLTSMTGAGAREARRAEVEELVEAERESGGRWKEEEAPMWVLKLLPSPSSSVCAAQESGSLLLLAAVAEVVVERSAWAARPATTPFPSSAPSWVEAIL